MTAKELITKIEQFKDNDKVIIEDLPNKHTKQEPQNYRIVVGLSAYPDGSNLKSNTNKYAIINEVAFFSTKDKPDLYFVLAILFGNMKEAINFIKIITPKKQNSTISFNDVIDYLADVEGYYFVNYNHNSFGSFICQFPSNSVKCLVVSTQLKLDKVNYQCLTNDAARIIHPSTQNLNTHSQIWIQQYVLNGYSGQIGSSSLTYQDFQL